jgi:D-alanyl-D-alanine carboxypeptidase
MAIGATLVSMFLAGQLALSDSVAPKLQSLADSIVRARPRLPGVLLYVESTRLNRKWAIASGQSDTARDRPMQIDQPVRIASNTKTYTASAILRLVEKGTIALNDPIAKHLPANLVAELERDGIPTKVITVEQVLSHRAGLNEHPSVPSYIASVRTNPTKRWTREEQVRLMVDSLQPVGPPGAQFKYSDTGYILLGAIVEKYTGKTLGGGVRELVGLDRLGLKHTWFETLEPMPAGEPERVHQYMNGFDTFGVDPSIDLYGGGGIAATISDLGGYLTLLLGGRVFDRKATLDTMMAIRSPDFLNGYGLGLFRVNTGGRIGYGHSGFWGTLAVHYPAEQLTIAVAVNEQSQGGAVFGILNAVVRAIAPLTNPAGDTGPKS